MKMFLSDNNSGVHPKIMEAIAACNSGHERPYGNDSFTQKAMGMFQTVFGEGIDVCFAATGTGANIIGLSSLLRPFECVICVDTAHINVDECGALERFSGSKIVSVPGRNGKISIDEIAPLLSAMGDEHVSQPRVISISQVTEMGTVYTVEEITELAEFAHAHGMLLHMDGARIANAAAALQTGFREMTRDAGVDLLSFGGTKNGMMLGEAIVSFDPGPTPHLKFVRKQGMHLVSKMRYISAQFIAYLEDGLWRENAEQANNMANLLTDCLESTPRVKLIAQPEANIIFAEIPKEWNKPLQEKSPYYIIDESTNMIRLVTSYDTTKDEVEEFIDTIRSLR